MRALPAGRRYIRIALTFTAYPFGNVTAAGITLAATIKPKTGRGPLGNIPTKELREARKHIHALLDPLWKSGKIKRGKLYAQIVEALGTKQFHTAEIRTIEEARKAYQAVKKIGRGCPEGAGDVNERLVLGARRHGFHSSLHLPAHSD